MKHLITALFITISGISILAQPNAGAREQKWLLEKPFQQNFFIENKGQFALENNETVLFGAESGYQAYFTGSGLVCRLRVLEEMTKEEEQAFEKAMEKSGHFEKEEEENERLKKLPHTYDLRMEWLGANKNVQVLAEEKASAYWNYLDPKDRTKSIEGAAGFKKIIYKDIYPGIDAIYTFHPESGLKYNLVVHPGADISQIKMQYSGAKKITLDQNGNLVCCTPGGIITDRAPQTFYEENGASINSEFKLNNNVVSFELGDYDNAKSIVIDPWMNSNLNPAGTVVELSTDAANNVYIYGFTGQIAGSNAANQYVQKYNAAGNLQWTFNFTSATNFLQNTGDIAVDPAGNSYVTCGFFMIGYFVADCSKAKLDPNGSLLWNSTSPLMYENWRIAFNCDHSQLVQFGCGPSCCNVGSGDIVNTGTGAESNKFSPPATGDIVSAAYGRNGNLYYISVADTSPVSHAHISCVNPSTNFSTVFSVPFTVSTTFKDGFNTGYGTYGFNGIVASCNYLYVCLGATLQKRDLSTGALLASVAVPGGVQHANSGAAVDKCGNVYVGSSTGVHVFDQNLNIIANFSTPKPVLDIAMGSNGTFYACGGSWTTSSNQGFVAQFALSTLCTPVTTTFTPNSCGAGNIGTATALPVFCAAPYTYQWSTNPVQTTQTATGLGAGTYTVIVTGAGACNEIDTATVTIPAGSLVASVATSTNVLCNGGTTGSAQAQASGGTAPYTYSWMPGAQSTQTATNLSAGIYSITITDAAGCSGTQTVNISQPAALNVTVTTAPTTCGASNGSATVNVTGGTAPYNYLWNPTGHTTSTVTNLAGGNYTVTVIDANGCTSLSSTLIAPSTPLSVTPSNNGPLCAGANLNLSCNTGVTWNWSGPNNYTSTSQNPVLSNVQTNASGTYTVNVTDLNGCVATATTNVTISAVPTPAASNNGPVCANQSLQLNVSGGTIYAWSGPNGFSSAMQNPNISQVSANANGVYTVTVSNSGNCSATATTNVIVHALPIVNAGGATVCLGGTVQLTSSGGVSYSWSGPNAFTSGQQNPSLPNANAAMGGIYQVTVTDMNGCANAGIAQVIITPALQVVASSNGPVCEGSVLNLSCNVGGNILWSGPGGFASSQQNPVIGNAQPGSAGVYTVTVTNAGGCSGSDTTKVVVNPLPTSVTPLSAAGCAPVCVNFANTSTATGTCQWNFGDGTISSDCNPTHCFNGEGTFNAVFTLTDHNGCKGTSVSIIHVYPVPHADFNADPQPASILEPEIHFANASSGGVITSYNWNFGDQHNSTQQNPVHTYQNTGNFPVQLIVTSDHGCADTIVKIISVEEDFEIFVPNAFTPNSDGSNDVFMAKGVGIEGFKMVIFDRWDNEVFMSNGLNKGWDGTLRGEDVQQDVYVWKIDLTHNKGLKKELSGTVSLIR